MQFVGELKEQKPCSSLKQFFGDLRSLRVTIFVFRCLEAREKNTAWVCLTLNVFFIIYDFSI